MNDGRKTKIERLEAMGVKDVRRRLINNSPEGDLVEPAVGWLRDKTAQDARRAKCAGWIAAIAAVLAVQRGAGHGGNGRMARLPEIWITGTRPKNQDRTCTWAREPLLAACGTVRAGRDAGPDVSVPMAGIRWRHGSELPARQRHLKSAQCRGGRPCQSCVSCPDLPDNDVTVHLVLNDSRTGLAYVETALDEADLETIIRNFIAGEYDSALRVVAFNAARAGRATCPKI
jgi:hypothetical protein